MDPQHGSSQQQISTTVSRDDSTGQHVATNSNGVAKDSMTSPAASMASVGGQPSKDDITTATVGTAASYTIDAQDQSVAEAGANVVGGGDVPATNRPTTANTMGPDKLSDAANIKDIVIHFEYLLEKSQQQFVGLRDLPPIGGRQWITYFQRTFEIYTKLWRFQQQNRAVLEKPENYGLKRREIGEIASKIGQLYYHYYLRTSETNYLQEAYTFYCAIRERNYLKDDPDSKNPALYIKKMRYYARFIVVCLLINKEPMVQDLLNELQEIIERYLRTFNPVDEKEWILVLKEIRMFLQVERKPIPADLDGLPHPVVHRLVSTGNPFKDSDAPRIRLQEAIIIGSNKEQIKFSELTMDMYRVLHALEREPNVAKESVSKDDTERTEKERPLGAKRANPHKYLLYKPTYGQMAVFLANVFKEVSEQGCALLYISGDGYVESSSPSESDKARHGFMGGIVIASHQKSPETDSTKGTPPIYHCIHTADLLPYTRKPLFVVIESTMSSSFRNFPSVFGQPYLFLLSPTEYPSEYDASRTGGHYTLFLNSPIMGFCLVSKLRQFSREKWQGLTEQMQELEKHVIGLLQEKLTDAEYKGIRRFLRDDFLLHFVIRHVIACGVFYLHNEYSKEKGLPSSSPELPEDLLFAPSILDRIFQLAKYMDVDDLYTPYQPPGDDKPSDVEEDQGIAMEEEEKGTIDSIGDPSRVVASEGDATDIPAATDGANADDRKAASADDGMTTGSGQARPEIMEQQEDVLTHHGGSESNEQVDHASKLSPAPEAMETEESQSTRH